MDRDLDDLATVSRQAGPALQGSVGLEDLLLLGRVVTVAL